MHIAGIVLGCVLLGQVSDGRLRPPEMVAEAMRLPNGSALGGQPVTVLSVLASSADRRQQLELMRAYWRLVQAMGEYRFCSEHVKNLGSVEPGGKESASLRLARASAEAMLRQSELEATGAQCELGRLMQLAPGTPLPLPADKPHVGPYRTNYQELFSGRTPPESAVLMERILPIRRQAIDARAAAVVAAEDVLTTLLEQPRHATDAETTCRRELLRQQRALMRAACDYNRDIAEYGLAVAAPATSPEALTAILIGPRQPTASNQAIGSPVGQASAGVPAPAAPRTGWRGSEPTLAPPRDAGKKQEPTLAPPRDAVRPASNEEPTLAPPRDKLHSLGKNEPTLAPPRKKAPKESAKSENGPLVPVQLPSASPSAPQSKTANKPVTDGQAAVPSASPLYPALVAAAPAGRAKQLAVALYWNRSLPAGIGKPLSLADCLMRDPGTDRRGSIEAYWLVSRRGAEYQVVAQQAELLDGLMPVALERRNEPTGAAEMLRLNWAQLATQASLREAQAALVESQYALALRIGATGEGAWPLASTVPHSGNYLLRLEAQPPGAVESWPVRRLAATIPALGQSVQQHAAAVVEADAARVTAAEQYRTGGAPIESAIEAVFAQTQETMAALNAISDYNRAIAEYALTVMSPATPVGKLVAALVVKP